MQLSKYITTLFLVLISSIYCFAQISNLALNSQAEVDAVNPSTTFITGNFFLGGDDIHDLSNLSNLTSIGGFLQIDGNDALLNVDEFSNLTYIGNYLYINGNDALLNIDGFSNLTSITGLLLEANTALLNVDGFSNLTSIGGLNITANDVLLNVDGFSNLTSIGGGLNITANDALLNVDGFSNLTSIGNNLHLGGNNTLLNIDGFSNLTSITGGLLLEANTALLNVDGFSNLTSIGNYLNINTSDALLNVDGFSNLTSIGGGLGIENNAVLSNLSGFSNLTSIGSNLSIQNNAVLTNCCAIQNLLITPNAISGNIAIENNLTTCDSQTDILDEDCGNNINIIEGNVFLDTDANCLFNLGDIPYEGVIVQANNYEYINTTVTDSLGDYKFYLDTGSYEVRAYMFNPYSQACIASYPVDILDDMVSDSFNFEFPTIINTYCPYLEVDISTWVLRECFDNNYYVQYCNSGTVDATNVYVELELDNVLSIADSSIPFTGPDMNNIYTFEIGTVNIGDCGSFNINIHLPCDSLDAGQFQGQTFCIDAHIYPDSICLPSSSIWDGSSIQVVGECGQDSVRFRVRNTGTGDMLSDKTLQVFEDQIMFTESPFQLQSNEEMILSYFANGSTFRLDAEQSDGHPGNSNPSVVIEACGIGSIFSLGFINQFSQDDGDVFVSSECREVTGSYDPNDKQAFPVGYGEEHFIEKNTDIEYLIRFQNTGTDTAFTVVIQDEISPLFDITTIQPGASSHPYVFEIDSVVRFVFNDILLVDSLTNEAESHGFVKFKISQQADLPNGTLLENTAEIYFDFNAPIITNTAFHTVGENFVTVNLIDGVENLFQISGISAYPNPFSDVIHFELDGNVFENIILSVFDVNGRQVAIKNYNSSTFQFHRENLNSGVYFYMISSEGIDIANGKMILR